MEANTQRERGPAKLGVRERGIMAAEYRAGASLRQVAKAHGSSYGAVRNVMLELGVTLRGRGSAPGVWNGARRDAVPR